MSNIENINDNNLKNIGPLKGSKKAKPAKKQGDMSPLLSADRDDVSTISISKTERELPKNELQKIEAWKEQLKEMPDVRSDKVKQAQQRLHSGFYNDPGAKDEFLSNLEEGLFP